MLLIEDSEGDAFIIKRYLSRVEGITLALHHATCLKDGLQLLMERQFDIVLLDMNLPDSERIETVQGIVNATDAAIVVLTSQPDDKLALSAFKAGIQDFIAKDKIDGTELIKVMNFALERQKRRNRLAQPCDNRDGLTGLLDRDSFIDTCCNTIRTMNDGDRLAFYVIHIRNMKDIIMEHSLHVGEAVLKAVAARLYGAFQSGKVFSRLEGDNFGLLQSDLTHDGHALYTARRIGENLSEPIDVSGTPVLAEVRIGIAFCPDHGLRCDTLYERASAAVKKACDLPDTHYLIYDSAIAPPCELL
ncbi:MAG: GGDEF domain-containing response regulator [Rhodospirillales bacterium]|nr:GGDEF domain-containing response regulator [Rhodospirillales bacterium]MCB9995325.1 GGDEF domain-containing response regulator [Rhodospirillales bacterium]